MNWQVHFYVSVPCMCMCMRMCIYMCKCIHKHVYIYTHIYIYIYKYIYIYMRYEIPRSSHLSCTTIIPAALAICSAFSLRTPSCIQRILAPEDIKPLYIARLAAHENNECRNTCRLLVWNSTDGDRKALMQYASTNGDGLLGNRRHVVGSTEAVDHVNRDARLQK